MANICNNKINITYFGTKEENYKTYHKFHKEINDIFLEVFPKYKEQVKSEINDDFEIDYEDRSEITYENIKTSFDIYSMWVAPIQIFQDLCNKYNIDIIGVAYEFYSGYVESFELKNELEKEEEEVIEHTLTFVNDSSTKNETISILPESQDDDILNDEFPLIDLSDKQLSNLN